MKKFEVGFYYDVNGTTIIEAESKEEAEAMLYKKLEDGGIEGLYDEYKVNDREYDTMCARELK